MIRRGTRDPLAPVADDGWYPGARPPAREDSAPAAIVGSDLGFSRNSSACAAARPVGQCVELVAWREWRPQGAPLRPSEVFRGIVAFSRQHGATRVIGDGHYREGAREVYDPAGIVFVGAPTVPAVAFLAVQRLLREGRVRGLDCPGEVIGARRPDEAIGLLRRQLESVREVRADGGHTRIEIPTTKDGRHGDVASAAVLALWGASRSLAAGYRPPIGASLSRG